MQRNESGACAYLDIFLHMNIGTILYMFILYSYKFLHIYIYLYIVCIIDIRYQFKAIS